MSPDPAVGSSREPHGAAAAAAPVARTSRVRSIAFACLFLCALLKIVIAIGIAAPALLLGRVGGRSWGHFANILVFGLAGAGLWFGAVRDRRGVHLGTLFVVIGAAFTDPFVAALDAHGSLASTIRGLSTESYIGYAFWAFVANFPTTSLRLRDRRLERRFTNAALWIGSVLCVANGVLAAHLLAPDQPGHAWLAALSRESPSGIFWLIVVGFDVSAVCHLLWKTRFDNATNRHRTAFLITGMVAAATPMTLAVLVSSMVPRFGLQSSPWVAVALYASLLSMVPTAIYAVAVHRVIDIQFVIRKTLQYALARSMVWAGSVLPLAYMAVSLYHDRERPVTLAVRRLDSGWLVFLIAIGAALTAFRTRVTQAIDRWFLREGADYPDVLARLERRLRRTEGLGEILGILSQELDRVFHPSALAVLLLTPDGAQLAPAIGDVEPLTVTSTLTSIVRSSMNVIECGAGQLDRLLFIEDRQWVLDGGFSLLAPLIDSAETLLGMVALGARRSELPYAAQDRALLVAFSGHTAFAIENQRLRELASGHAPSAPSVGVYAVDVQNEPGALCDACGRMWRSGIYSCECGGRTRRAPLPLVINGKFHVARLVGSGGMGVVFLATDIALNRPVAIKTLPALSEASVSRLHGEARAMAVVEHPNLALIFGVERWRGLPLLVVEYCDRGTLADRLQRGPLHFLEAIELAVILCDVLDVIHSAGVLHRDIKPSNIAFTRHGTPKLLDFGLAAFLTSDLSIGVVPVNDLATFSSTMSNAQIVGTPIYLSPEALAGQTPDIFVDLWGVAVVLFESLTGAHPFGSGDFAAICDRIRRGDHDRLSDLLSPCPPAVTALLDDALAIDVTRRCSSAGDFRARLQRIRADFLAAG